jgi:hypothetical protein
VDWIRIGDPLPGAYPRVGPPTPRADLYPTSYCTAKQATMPSPADWPPFTITAKNPLASSTKKDLT